MKGYGPTGQSAFDDRYVGWTVSPSSLYSVSFTSPGRFKEYTLAETFDGVFEFGTFCGSHTYTSTGLSSGSLSMAYDDGEHCTFRFNFDSSHRGTAVSSCLGSAAEISWKAERGVIGGSCE